ncbi:alpha/beta hydrolase [Actinomadura fibrosa]|uniref:Alpha/beta hydrolase n=1 Tax=Actinomadura fibrosa TaxID=111802 RepID=A0ABW2XGH1_9ACTN|nr:alpha/beta hydrolase fold domain-containing protein [Actinomadura fibrosa]
MTHEFHPAMAARLKQATDDPEHLWAPVGPPEEWDLDIEEDWIPGPDVRIRVRIYRPKGETAARPALVWLHGGAWVGGDLDMPEAHETARGVAGRAGAVVVSVDYRLCGEKVHFPAPHDDVVAAYRWVREHGGDLGVDPARIAIGGASAGADLAAGAALRLRDEGEAPWQALLLYPCVHAPLPEPSPELAAALEKLPKALHMGDDLMEEVIPLFLDGPLDTASPYAMPGVAEDLRGFPPTYLDNDEFDTLRSSGELFGDRLRADGVDVEQVTSYGVLHGHLNIVGFEVAHATLDRMAARLRRTS